MTDKTPIAAPAAPLPRAGAPYSQAVAAGPFVFVSGQLPIDPETGEVVAGAIAEQTERVLRNLEAVLAAAGAGLGDVVKTTVFLASLEDWEAMNAVYARFLGPAFPARSAVECRRLALGARVEIEAVALRAAQ